MSKQEDSLQHQSASQAKDMLENEIGNGQDVVPYDEYLFERARTQWQFGDWHSLARLDGEVLKHHPDRAKLALLAAAGRLQIGNVSEARSYLRQAIDWGASKNLVARILVGGVHNSLGRISALTGNQARALENFEAAVIVGIPGADARLFAQARFTQQLKELGIFPDADKLPKAASEGVATFESEVPQLASSVNDLIDTLKQQKSDIEIQLKKQADEILRLRKNLKVEVANAARQIGDFFNLQNYFNSGKIPDIKLEINSWAASSDFMLYLVKLIDANNYDLIIEFGSGVSTVVIAKTVGQLESRRIEKPPLEFMSFDHLEQYYQQTMSQLKLAGVDNNVQLVLAPLEEYKAANGEVYPYYACETALSGLMEGKTIQGLRVFVLVDGPPASTGNNARYPALPFVLRHLRGARIDFFLDDTNRPQEKAVVELWKTYVSEMGMNCSSQYINLEKGACLFCVE